MSLANVVYSIGRVNRITLFVELAAVVTKSKQANGTFIFIYR